MVIELIEFMGEHGIRFPRYDLDKVIDYIQRMIDDGRVITVNNECGLHTFIMFSMCSDTKPFHKKKTWQYVAQHRNGNIVYIEKLVSKRYSKEIRKKIEEKIKETHPNYTKAVWHRWAAWGDREVIYRRARCMR